MNEQQLLYFQRLAQRQNLSKTAAELIISPPALSATIRRLEEELGCQLFDRIGRNIYLNQNGEIFLQHAKDALAALALAREELAATQARTENHLTVGLASPLTCHDALQAFVIQHPEIHLTYRLLRIDQLQSSSLKYEVDFVIASEQEVPSRDWDGILIKNDNPLVLAVYASHPFAARQSICLTDIAKEPYIAIPRDYCFRCFTDKLFADAGLKPNIILECDFSLRSAMLDAKYGVLLVTTAAQKSGFSLDTVFVPLTNPKVNYPWYLFEKRKPTPSNTARKFKEFLVSFYRSEMP